MPGISPDTSLKISVPLPPVSVAERIRAYLAGNDEDREAPGRFTGEMKGSGFRLHWEQHVTSRNDTSFTPTHQVTGTIEPSGEGSLVTVSISQLGSTSLVIGGAAALLVLSMLTGTDIGASAGGMLLWALPPLAGILAWSSAKRIGTSHVRARVEELVGARPMPGSNRA